VQIVNGLTRQAEFLSYVQKFLASYWQPIEYFVVFHTRVIQEFHFLAFVSKPQFFVGRLFVSDDRDVYFPCRSLNLGAFVIFQIIQVSVVFSDDRITINDEPPFTRFPQS
jgi:hypothetical protein